MAQRRQPWLARPWNCEKTAISCFFFPRYFPNDLQGVIEQPVCHEQVRTAEYDKPVITRRQNLRFASWKETTGGLPGGLEFAPRDSQDFVKRGEPGLGLFEARHTQGFQAFL